MKLFLKTISMILVILVSISIISPGSYAFAEENIINKKTILFQPTENPMVENSLLILFKDGKFPKNITKQVKGSLQANYIKEVPEIGLVKIDFKDSSQLNEGRRYINGRFSGEIQAIGHDTKVKPTPIGNKKLYPGNQPSLYNIKKSPENYTLLSTENGIFSNWRWDIDLLTHQRQSYAIQKGNHRVKVAILDSGIDFNHPDLKNNILSKGRSFVPGQDTTQDYLGHGTMVAGTIAANGNLMGVGPNLGIVPYAVINGQTGDGESSWTIEAIIQAAKDGMDVINLSLGTYKSLTINEDRTTILAYEKAILFAKKMGTVVVASSGTEGFNIGDPKKLAEQKGLKDDLQIHAPGGLPGVITVSATNRDNKLADYSNYGWNVDVAAPAGDYGPLWTTENKMDLRYMTLTTYPTNLPQSALNDILGFPPGYVFMTGTSLAAPKVSATVALIIAELKEKTGKNIHSPFLVQQILYKSVNDAGAPGKDQQYGYGIIDTYQALKNTQTMLKINNGQFKNIDY